MKAEIKQFITVVIIFAVAFLLLVGIYGNVEAQQSHVWHTDGITFKLNKGPGDLDGWSMGHFGGGAVFYYAISELPTFVGWEISPKRKLLYTIIAGVVYEIYVDGFGNKFPFASSIAGNSNSNSSSSHDPRGADLKGDVVFTAFGGAVACTLDLLFRLDKKKYKIIVKDQQVGVMVGF